MTRIPTTFLQCDVEPEADENLTPREVAARAWETIAAWVEMDYLPVFSVQMSDGSTHVIDLEEP